MSSTNKTTYYELPQFVDNDIFNPLVDDNDAYSKIDTALHNIADAEADNASDIVSIKGRLDSTENDIDALEAQNGNSVLTTTAQTLSGAVNELDADISALDGRLDIVEDDINNATTGLKVKVSALETQNGSEVLNTTSQTLSGGINELDAELNTANTGIDARLTTVENTVGDNSSGLVKRIGDAESNISTLSTSVKNLGDNVYKKVVLITDSYGQVQSNGFPNALRAKLGATLHTNFFYSAVGGSGFTNGDKTFLEQLQALELAENYDKTGITDIVVVGGVNDGINTYNDIYSAITSFYQYVIANYANAKIHIGFISRSTDTGAILNMANDVLRAYKLAGNSMPKMSYITGSEVWLSYDDIDADKIHPTAGGCNWLGWFLGSYLIGGYTTPRIANHNSYQLAFDVTGIVSYSTSTLYIDRYDSADYHISSTQILVELTGFDGNSFHNGIKIASCTQPLINSPNFDSGVIPVVVSLLINGTWYDVAGLVSIRLDGIYLKCLAPYHLTSETVSQLAIWQGIHGDIDPFMA